MNMLTKTLKNTLFPSFLLLFLTVLSRADSFETISFSSPSFSTASFSVDSFSQHVSSSSSPSSPVITSTITLVPTGIGYTGDIPGATGADFAPSSAGGSPSFVFKVSHTGNLNFTVNMIYAVSATIAIEYRKATSGSWTVLDSYSTDYEEYFGRGGTISDIAGYAEIRLTITDYNGFGDVSYASFVFTPQ